MIWSTEACKIKMATAVVRGTKHLKHLMPLKATS